MLRTTPPQSPPDDEEDKKLLDGLLRFRTRLKERKAAAKQAVQKVSMESFSSMPPLPKPLTPPPLPIATRFARPREEISFRPQASESSHGIIAIATIARAEAEMLMTTIPARGIVHHGSKGHPLYGAVDLPRSGALEILPCERIKNGFCQRKSTLPLRTSPYSITSLRSVHQKWNCLLVEPGILTWK
jgi:hypothetical protein